MKKLKLLDPLITTGLIISISLAVILVLIGQDEVSSLIVGLVVTAIALTIDVIVRLREAEQRILGATSLVEALSEDEELQETIRQIAQSYLEVQNSEFELFIQRSRDVLSECKDILAGLERGYLTTEAGGKYSYGKRGVDSAEKTVKAIAYEDIESWRTIHLKGVIASNAKAIERGVQIQRIFILSEPSLSQANDVLQEHAQAGVDVYTVSPDDLPSTDLLESYMIADDRILVTFLYTRDGRLFRGEKICVEPLEVDRAISNFTAVLRRAKPFQNGN